jgi:hypothetical protein
MPEPAYWSSSQHCFPESAKTVEGQIRHGRRTSFKHTSGAQFTAIRSVRQSAEEMLSRGQQVWHTGAQCTSTPNLFHFVPKNRLSGVRDMGTAGLRGFQHSIATMGLQHHDPSSYVFSMREQGLSDRVSEPRGHQPGGGRIAREGTS